MKKLKKFIILIIIALVMQSGFLVLLNNYLANDTTSAIKKVEVKKDDLKKKNNIKINSSSKSLQLSYDGKYISYIDNSIINIINTTDGSGVQYKPENNAKADYYKWIPDKDSFAVSEITTQNNKTNIKFYLYDVDKNKKDTLLSENNTEVNVEINSTLAHISQVLLNSNNKICYIKTDESVQKLYKINAKSQIEQIKIDDFAANNIIMTKDKSILYEDSNNKIKMLNEKELSIYKYTILGIDNNDIIYIGSLDKNKKVKAVYYGRLGEKIENYKKYQLDEPLNSSEIYIALNDGTIYINNNLKGSVKNLTTGKETYYKGLYLKTFNKGIASIDNNKLSIAYFDGSKN